MLGFVAMIRINLAGQPKGRRRRSRGLPDVPNLGVLVFLLVLVMEGAALYSWHAAAAEQASLLSGRLRKAKMELDTAKKLHAEITGVKTEIAGLRTTELLFEELEGEKRGPVGALTWLSFMLKERKESEESSEVLKQLESAGWRTNWDARRAWFTSIREGADEVTLQGEALDHEDVAEVLRRLESSAHFRNIQLVFQERRREALLDIDFISFTMRGTLVYLVEPYLTEEKRAEIAAAAVAAAEAAAALVGGTGEAAEVGDAPAQPDSGRVRLPSERAPPSSHVESVPVPDAATEAAAPSQVGDGVDGGATAEPDTVVDPADSSPTTAPIMPVAVPSGAPEAEQ